MFHRRVIPLACFINLCIMLTLSLRDTVSPMPEAVRFSMAFTDMSPTIYAVYALTISALLLTYHWLDD